MRMSYWLSKLSAGPQARANRSTKVRTARVAEVFETRLVLTPAGQFGSIAGAVWNDVDHDGVFDFSPSNPSEQLEPGIPGRTVYVDLNQNGQFDQPVRNVSAADVPKDLPDVKLTSSNLVVSGTAGSITDVDVTLQITHTYRGDLLIELISPLGTRVTLSSNTGDGQDDFAGTVFDDQATDDIADATSAEGHFRPSSALSVLNGEDPDGTWTLSITDTAGGDVGNLAAWSLTITTDDTANSEPFATTDFNGQYQITSLPVGTYQVRQVVPFGFEQTSPTEDGGRSVVVASNSTTSQVNFGSAAIPGRIRGQHFSDHNGDGFRDQEDLGVDGVEILLLDSATLDVLHTQTTFSSDLNGDETIDPFTESGLYEFTDLEPGEYTVVLAPHDGIMVTFPEADQGNLDDQIVQAGTYTASTPPTGTPGSPVQWLPDMISNMESEAGMRNWYQDGNSLRFGQATPNVGFGPMRLVAGPDQGDGTQIVYQRIFDDQGGFTDRVAGLFEFHPAHNHIHFNDYAHYQLRAALPELDDDGNPLVGDVVRSANKTSFCLINVDTFDTSLPNFDADGSGFGCGENQEISVGWEDIYSAGTEGQEINVAGLEPGQYWLEGIIDPDNQLMEVDETNNYGRVLVTIGSGDRSYHYTIEAASDIAGADFGSFEKVDVSGKVFDDIDGNGAQDSGDAGLAGRAVFLDLNYDGVLNNPTSGDGIADGLAQEPWALTDSNGHFAFHDVENGFFSVRMVTNPGERLTTENELINTVSGENITDLTFGIGDPIATLEITLDNGVLTIRDVSQDGVDNALIIDAGGIDTYLIHDFNAVVSDGVGTVIDLHTVTVPKSEVTSIVIETGAGDDGVTVVSTLFDFSSVAHMIHSPAALLFTAEDDAHDHDHDSDHEHEHEEESDGDPPVKELAGEDDELPIDYDINQDGVIDENDVLLILSVVFGTGQSDVITTDVNLTQITATMGSGDDLFLGYLSVPMDVAGNDGDDGLFAYGASGTLRGGDGDDVLLGGTENDYIDGGAGDDTVFAEGDVDFTLTNFSLSGLGSDALMSIESAMLSAGDGDNRIDASAFSAGPVTLSGGSGDDTLIGGASDDTLIGDPNLFPAFAAAIDFSEEAGEDDHGEIDDNEIVTFGFNHFAGDDLLIAGGGNDKVLGIGGSDTFVWNEGDGSDEFFGGEGATSTVQVRLGDQADAVQLSHVEGGPDVIARTNRAQFSIVIFGISNVDIGLGGGHDVFNGTTASLDVALTVSGGNGHDFITGTDCDDVLNGDVGNDTINAGWGNDLVFGGSGADSLSGQADNDTVYGQSGDGDVVSGGLGDDMLNGGTGINDTVSEDLSVIVNSDRAFVRGIQFLPMTIVGLGTDTYRTFEGLRVFGSNRSDAIDASGFTSGPANLMGGAGDDSLAGGTGNDALNGGLGFDTIYSLSDANQTLTNAQLVVTARGSDALASIEAAVLIGGLSANQINASGFSLGAVTINGGGGADTLTGGSKADLIVGDDEDSPEANPSQALIPDDLITGGLGDDTLVGGFASDRFLWNFGEGNDRFEASFESNSQLVATLNATSNHWVVNRGREELVVSSDDSDGTHLSVVGVANLTFNLGSGDDSFDASAFALVDDVHFTVNGGDGNDRVTGSGASDLLSGGAGRDLLLGGDGDDTLQGGDQADTLDGGDGNDQVFGDGNSGDLLTGGRGFDIIDGGNGQDILSESLHSDANVMSLNSSILSQLDQDDDFPIPVEFDAVVSIEAAKLIGSAGDDILEAAQFLRGPVTLQGGAGRDFLIGTRGDDVLDGGADEDVLYQQADGNQVLSDGFLVGKGTDTLIGIEGVALEGSDAANVIEAKRFTGVAVIDSGAGNDQIFGGTGGLIAIPGAGNDSITGNSAHDAVALLVEAHIRITDVQSIGEGIDTLNSIENALMLGNSITNVMDASAFSGNTLFIGDDGDDRFLAGKGLFAAVGGAGTDTIVVSRATATTAISFTLTSVDDFSLLEDLFDYRDLEIDLDFDLDPSIVPLASIERADITTGSGDDTINALAISGPVTINSGAGNDTILGTELSDSINAGEGNDSIASFAGNDTILSGAGNDRIVAGDGDDSVIGNNGADTITGNGGSDSILGGAGDDILSGGTLPGINATLTGSSAQGNDTVNGEDGNDVVLGSSGNDQLFGGTGNDLVFGSTGNDNLVGGAGHDTLIGDVGNDTLAGASGRDFISGGTGDDMINAGVDTDADSVDGGAGSNLIVTYGGDTTATLLTPQIDFIISQLLGLA